MSRCGRSSSMYSRTKIAASLTSTLRTTTCSPIRPSARYLRHTLWLHANRPYSSGVDLFLSLNPLSSMHSILYSKCLAQMGNSNRLGKGMLSSRMNREVSVCSQTHLHRRFRVTKDMNLLSLEDPTTQD